ncbi:MAG: NADH-quinone oxidoreductase subunit NuoK [Microscillaceae bacterium]|nr:NADH-quinone oxidoreductase subunit NuoK [Microscillaceae bacterium]MDW8461354.1 NADH-quinone oxidoreductase subunit NuoK [Cytophagales bacterium]
MPATAFLLLLAAFLFCVGIFLVLTKRNAILILIGVELMLNAANLNFVFFSQYDKHLQGQIFALFILAVAVSEVAIALALLVKIYKYYQTINLDEIK